MSETLGQQSQAAIRRVQDADWESWTPKQRKKARANSEFYGGDRDMAWLFAAPRQEAWWRRLLAARGYRK